MDALFELRTSIGVFETAQKQEEHSASAELIRAQLTWLKSVEVKLSQVVSVANLCVAQDSRIRNWPRPKDAEDSLGKELRKAGVLMLSLGKALEVAQE